MKHFHKPPPTLERNRVKKPWTAPKITEILVQNTHNGLPLGTPPGECCAYPTFRSEAYKAEAS